MSFKEKLLTFLAVVFVLFTGMLIVRNTNVLKTGIAEGEKASYDAIGTSSASSTLTASYSGNTKTLYTYGQENLHLDIEYSTPSTTNRYMYILIEGSNDGGVSYFPMTTKVNGTTEIDLYTEDLDCGATCAQGNIGIPIIFPGDKTSTTSLYYKGTYDTDIVADLVRISAKETGTANFGKTYIRATFSSKN